MEMRPGYKPTEVGVIPEDWDVHTIDEIASVTSGKRLPLGSSLVQNSTPHPYIRVTDMRPGTVDLAEIRYVPESVFPAIKRYRIYTDDLFISVAGSLGIVGKVPKELDGANLTENADRITNIACSQDFLLHVLMSPLIQNVIDSIQTVGAQPKLALTRIRKFVVPQPPLPEQRAIAGALSEIDALLSGLDRLIAKKRDLKQAVMQRLLTGQTRLPGFQGEWEVKWLGDIGTFFKGCGVKKDQSQSGDLPCIRYGEIYTHHHDHIRSFNSRISTGVAKTATRLKTGDLLFAGSGETKAEIGKCVAFLHDCDAYAGGDIVILRPTGVDSMFMGYYCNTPPIVAQKASKGQGDAVVHISASALASVSVTLPSLAEQSAIAVILADMDAEIYALEARRDKTRALKQGMMQELLTGRTRLVDAIPSAPVQAQVPTPERKPNIHFLRSVLAAEIVDRLHQEPTFGHVKLEKMVFLAEHLCQVDTGSTYLRKAAGPLDPKALRSIDSQLRSQQWFDARKQEGRYTYVPLAKHGGHKTYFDRYYTPIATKLSGIIETFRALSTERCEIVATLYAAWNDLLRDRGAASDDAIVHEVLNHWHEAKQRIPEDRWRKALDWMREKGFVPHGAVAG